MFKKNACSNVSRFSHIFDLFMRNGFTTERLTVHQLNLNDAEFILELVNTPGWIKFIGDRKVNALSDAKAYIKNIKKNSSIKYWGVKLQSSGTAVGIVTLIKRDYLTYHDIGFAFLPQYAKNGYAFEAASALLSQLSKEFKLNRVLATTVNDNVNSFRLLTRLGFQFDTEIQIDDKSLKVYSLELAIKV